MRSWLGCPSSWVPGSPEGAVRLCVHVLWQSAGAFPPLPCNRSKQLLFTLVKLIAERGEAHQPLHSPLVRPELILQVHMALWVPGALGQLFPKGSSQIFNT